MEHHFDRSRAQGEISLNRYTENGMKMVIFGNYSTAMAGKLPIFTNIAQKHLPKPPKLPPSLSVPLGTPHESVFNHRLERNA